MCETLGLYFAEPQPFIGIPAGRGGIVDAMTWQLNALVGAIGFL
jgi:hypothetical protein